MGNALLDILSMGRRAGAKATSLEGSITTSRAGIDHVHAWQRELTATGLPLDVKAPQLFPSYAHFDLQADAGLRSGSQARVIGGVR
jgi:succinate dehydrogenase / fumarate reductase flavoprotein subunit/L-aspartate oxidase